jgi:hypothetical protein
LASVTWTVKVEVVLFFHGVPEMSPVVSSSFNPFGKLDFAVNFQE